MVCLVGGYGLEGVGGECLCGVRGVIVESGVVGLVCGLGWGIWESRAKKLYCLVAPFEIADFRGE